MRYSGSPISIRQSWRYAWMIGLTCLLLALTSCGGGRDGTHTFLSITRVAWAKIYLRQSPMPFDGTVPGAFSEPIVAGRHETDQPDLHLYGHAFSAEFWGCDFWVTPTDCSRNIPSTYIVSWVNEANGTTGEGLASVYDVQSGEIEWSSNSLYHDRRIPLEMGENTIRVTAQDRQREATASVVITRIEDTSPPVVARVSPEDGSEVNLPASGSYRLEALFNQPVDIDPTSVDEMSFRLTNTATMESITGSVDSPSKYSTGTYATFLARGLSPASNYTARLTGIFDLTGNVMPDYTWSFAVR